MVRLENLVRLEERQLSHYIENSEASVMIAVVEKIEERTVTESWLEKWAGKVMHGQFVRQTEEVRGNKSWMWMTKGSLK